MTIQFAGDLHLEFPENREFLGENPLDVSGDILLLAGDSCCIDTADNYKKYSFWDWASANYKKVILCMGNHEFYNYIDVKSYKEGTVVNIRDNVAYYYNKTVEIDDVVIIVSTLWSHIEDEFKWISQRNVADFYRIIYGDTIITADDFNTLHRQCFNFIKTEVERNKGKKIIVMTHHVPSFDLNAKEFSGSVISGVFTVELKDYIASSGIDYWIYGHSHRNIEGVIGTTKCICNQLGYVSHNEHHEFSRNKTIEI